MTKIVKVDRKHVEADPGGKFTLIDTGGMRWHGDCRAVDHGPKDHYAVVGTVTIGPAEWVGLEVVVHGQYSGRQLSVEPALLYAKRVRHRVLSPPFDPVARCVNVFEPGALIKK